MLKRDFTKSNLKYIKSNAIAISVVSAVLVLAIIVGIFFGFNLNFEMKGYNEFSVNIVDNQTTNVKKHIAEIGNIVNSYGGKYDSTQIQGQGDNTVLVVRYSNDINDDVQIEINQKIAEKLEIDVTKISGHTEVGSRLNSRDIIFTIAAILVLITIVALFTYFRYNICESVTSIITLLFANFGYLALVVILRLSIGMSFFAILFSVNVYTGFALISIFESIRSSNWLKASNYSKAIETAMKENKSRITAINIALLIFSVLMIIVVPDALKFIAVNIMFVPVICLASTLYILPFCWNFFVTIFKTKTYRVKSNEEKN